MAVNGILKYFPVGGTPGRLITVSTSTQFGILSWNLQPINFLSVRQLENEFIDDTIHSNSPADQLQFSVARILENEVIPIKLRQLLSPNTSRQLGKLVSWLEYTSKLLFRRTVGI